mmetsp:Transcript_30314/g.97873  ORF Transcript_30314/g.97873 Transcript_30314/m.97873 type:complete len:256 (-) Transcript_30314:480-1247(-)
MQRGCVGQCGRRDIVACTHQLVAQGWRCGRCPSRPAPDSELPEAGDVGRVWPHARLVRDQHAAVPVYRRDSRPTIRTQGRRRPVRHQFLWHRALPRLCGCPVRRCRHRRRWVWPSDGHHHARAHPHKQPAAVHPPRYRIPGVPHLRSGPCLSVGHLLLLLRGSLWFRPLRKGGRHRHAACILLLPPPVPASRSGTQRTRLCPRGQPAPRSHPALCRLHHPQLALRRLSVSKPPDDPAPGACPGSKARTTGAQTGV